MKLAEDWHAINPAWKFALGAFLIARVSLTIWSLIVAFLLPIQVKNLDLFGAPVLATFDPTTSERHAYSRELDGHVLSFRATELGYVTDARTSSVWSLRDGHAVSGSYSGRVLNASPYSVEDIFPYRGVAAETNPLLAVWQRFDANWYLKIAQRGYAPDDGSTVYFPLYPALIRLAGGSLFAALFISNAALAGALYLLYRLTETLTDSSLARRTVMYLLLFPTGFFLFGAYTESLFLFFTLGAFLFATRQRWYLAALFGALAALTRLQGVWLLVPLAYMWWKWTYGVSYAHSASRRIISGVTLLVIPLATATFLVSTKVSLLSTLGEQWRAQYVAPWETIAASITWLASGQGNLVDGLNLAALAIFGLMIFALWKRMKIEYVLYALGLFLVPLFRLAPTQPLVSTIRYALPIFPVFILWGAWGRNAWVNRVIVYVSLPLQLYLSAQFVMWGWVG